MPHIPAHPLKPLEHGLISVLQRETVWAVPSSLANRTGNGIEKNQPDHLRGDFVSWGEITCYTTSPRHKDKEALQKICTEIGWELIGRRMAKGSWENVWGQCSKHTTTSWQSAVTARRAVCTNLFPYVNDWNDWQWTMTALTCLLREASENPHMCFKKPKHDWIKQSKEKSFGQHVVSQSREAAVCRCNRSVFNIQDLQPLGRVYHCMWLIITCIKDCTPVTQGGDSGAMTFDNAFFNWQHRTQVLVKDVGFRAQDGLCWTWTRLLMARSTVQGTVQGELIRWCIPFHQGLGNHPSHSGDKQNIPLL